MAASSCRVLLSSSRAPGFLHGLVPLSYTVNLVPMRLDLIENKLVMKCLHLFIFFRCWQHFVSHLSHVDWQKATHCLFSKYQANSNYWMLQFILTVSKQNIFGITLDVILKKRGKSERLQCNPTGQLSRPKWMSLSLPLMGSDCQAQLSTLWKGSLQRCVSHIKKKSRSEISPEVRCCWKKKVWMWVRVGGSQARKRREASCSVVHGLWLNFWNQAMVCYTLLYFCQAHTGDQLSYKWMDRWNVFTAYFDWNQYYQSNRKINHL